ncbi:hypothetical protein RIF29_33936 [Crotalaria pallida]|uniref:Uncharacterized protein n=1 Tax=Crotalaria pallida TaxID=3830 RepID=A0AAN9HR02_CROPI
MAKVKQTTGIVGLDVVPNAREVLIGLYSKTLNEVKAVPEDEGYRKVVESFTNHRLKVCQEGRRCWWCRRFWLLTAGSWRIEADMEVTRPKVMVVCSDGDGKQRILVVLESMMADPVVEKEI